MAGNLSVGGVTGGTNTKEAFDKLVREYIDKDKKYCRSVGDGMHGIGEAGLTKTEYEDLKRIAQQMVGLPNERAQEVGKLYLKQLKMLKDFPENEKNLRKDIKAAEERLERVKPGFIKSLFNKIMGYKMDDFEVKLAEENLKEARSNIISGKTIWDIQRFSEFYEFD